MKLERPVYESLVAHMKKGYPNEACGILGGTTAKGGSAFFPMRNMDESSISYFMDPKEQLLVFKKLRELKLEMTGIVHSHVASEAYPSQKDIRLAFYPDVSYLIVSLSEIEKPVLRSYRIVNEKVTEENIEII